MKAGAFPRVIGNIIARFFRERPVAGTSASIVMGLAALILVGYLSGYTLDVTIRRSPEQGQAIPIRQPVTPGYGIMPTPWEAPEDILSMIPIGTSKDYVLTKLGPPTFGWCPFDWEHIKGAPDCWQFWFRNAYMVIWFTNQGEIHAILLLKKDMEDEAAFDIPGFSFERLGEVTFGTIYDELPGVTVTKARKNYSTKHYNLFCYVFPFTYGRYHKFQFGHYSGINVMDHDFDPTNYLQGRPNYVIITDGDIMEFDELFVEGHYFR